VSRAQTPKPALREKVSTMPQLERQKEERKDSLQLIRDQLEVQSRPSTLIVAGSSFLKVRQYVAIK
jgi:hypothetical protein